MPSQRSAFLVIGGYSPQKTKKDYVIRVMDVSFLFMNVYSHE